MTDISGAVAASCCSFGEERTTRRDPVRRGTKPGRLTPKDLRTRMDAERRRRYRDNLLSRSGRRPLNWKTQIGSFPVSDRRPTFRVWWLLIFAVCWIYEQQKRDPDRRGTKPGRLTPKKWAETIGKSRASGMDERRLRRNREGRSEPPRLNRWRRRLAESMPSPGLAQPGRGAKPRPWPTGAGGECLDAGKR